MTELLESKDLLSEPRVANVASAMGLQVYCGTVVGSLADTAFAMRDACDRYAWLDFLDRIAEGPLIMTSTAGQWVVASVLVQEATS